MRCCERSFKKQVLNEWSVASIALRNRALRSGVLRGNTESGRRGTKGAVWITQSLMTNLRCVWSNSQVRCVPPTTAFDCGLDRLPDSRTWLGFGFVSVFHVCLFVLGFILTLFYFFFFFFFFFFSFSYYNQNLFRLFAGSYIRLLFAFSYPGCKWADRFKPQGLLMFSLTLHRPIALLFCIWMHPCLNQIMPDFRSINKNKK